MTASLILSWLAIGALAIAVTALARQIGVLHERIAPVGALKLDRGPRVGESAPAFNLLTLDERPIQLGRASPGVRAQLLLFVSPDCPVCKRVIPIAKRFVAQEGLEIVFVGDGAPAAHRRMIERFGLQHLAFVNSAEVGLRYGIGKLPYAVLIDAQGIVAASGLVNSLEHLESLVVSFESGYASVQDYLRRPHAPRPIAEPSEA